MKLKSLLVLMFLFSGCWGSIAFAGTECCVAVEANDVFVGSDDLGGAGLAEAAKASLQFFKGLPSSRAYRYCDQEYTVSQLAESLTEFIALYREKGGSDDFTRELNKRFKICAASGDERDGKVLVTGYFEPLVEGRLQKKPPYVHPLYRVPADLVKRGGQSGRIIDGQRVPYWTRAQIENEGVLAGNEIVYLDDPVEAFILHVQGSGRVRLRDGTIRKIQFGAKNGLPYKSIGKFLVDQGKMELSQVNLPTIIEYLAAHPEERQSVLQHNESFVFFRWGDGGDSGPEGALGQSLTAGRSIALDHDCFPPGALGFLMTRKPVFNADDEIVGWAPLQRFVLNQDSGSAIKGAGRVDLFWGAGDQARQTAGIMKHPGRLYFLVKNK